MYSPAQEALLSNYAIRKLLSNCDDKFLKKAEKESLSSKRYPSRYQTIDIYKIKDTYNSHDCFLIWQSWQLEV